MSRIVLMGKEHRWLTAAGLAVAVALALILVPVTFERTVGHTVELSVRGEDLTGVDPSAWVERLAGAGASVDERPGAMTVVVDSSNRTRERVETQVAALVQELGSRGLVATSKITPRLETTSGNVYAAARWHIYNLRVRLAGRTEAEVAADLREQLMRNGHENPEVRVAINGNETQIGIESTADAGRRQKHIELKRTGESGEAGFEVPMRELNYEPRPGMTDEEIRDEILKELAAQGDGDAQVEVKDGRIEVQVTRSRSQDE